MGRALPSVATERSYAAKYMNKGVLSINQEKANTKTLQGIRVKMKEQQ